MRSVPSLKAMLGREGCWTPLVHCPWPRPWSTARGRAPGSASLPSLRQERSSVGKALCGAQLPGDAGRVGLHGERARRSARPPPRPAPPQTRSDCQGASQRLSAPLRLLSSLLLPRSKFSPFDFQPRQNPSASALRRPRVVTWLQVSSFDCSGKDITILSPCTVQ